jgi:L-lactate dehydrogenase complex protein LldE
MVADKAQAITDTGAEQLVSGDCGCLMNITGHMQHQGIGPKGQHIASFLWERTHAAKG